MHLAQTPGILSWLLLSRWTGIPANPCAGGPGESKEIFTNPSVPGLLAICLLVLEINHTGTSPGLHREIHHIWPPIPNGVS